MAAERGVLQLFLVDGELTEGPVGRAGGDGLTILSCEVRPVRWRERLLRREEIVSG